jgi:hypothetical protein
MTRDDPSRMQLEDLHKTFGDTMFQRAINDADTPRGRFSAEGKPSVVGAGANYPRQPPNSPYASDPVPDEAPLGYEINAQPPTGEFHEIQASMVAASRVHAAAGPATAPPSTDAGRGEAGGETAQLSPGMVSPSGPELRRRKL